MNKKEAIKKIEEAPEKYLNIEQKIIGKKIMNSINEKEVQAYFDFIMKRTGLGFRFDIAPEVANGRIAVVNEMMKKSINTSKNIEENENKLIIGDNFEALKNLLLTHKEKIDVIYIDPPYNTESAKKDGNDSSKENTKYSKFIYKDKFGRNGWLNLIRERLLLAKDLLKDDGVIFVSIDDNEQAYLKILMDEVFEENNFISNITWQSKPSSGTDPKFLANLTEYILFYTRNKKNFNINKIKKNLEKDKSFNLKDKHFKIRGKYKLSQLEDGGLTYSKKLDYVIKDENYNKYYAGGYERWIERQKYGIKVLKDYQWRWSEEKVKWGIKNDFIILKNNKVYKKSYQFVDNKLNKKELFLPFENLILSSNKKAKKNEIQVGFSTNQGTIELRNIFNGSKIFDHPKSSKLIKYLINFHPNKKSLILDFFVGTGTTGQATLDLNREDGGNRKFILVTNNENNIGLGIAYERLYRIINGCGTNKENDFEWLKKNEPFLNTKLRVFNIKHYNVQISEIDKLEEITKEAKENLKKLNSNYLPSKIDIYSDLNGLNPYNDEQKKQIYSTDPIKKESTNN